MYFAYFMELALYIETRLSSNLCISLRCCAKLAACEKNIKQIWQMNGFCPLCFLMWDLTLHDFLKTMPQLLYKHLKLMLILPVLGFITSNDSYSSFEMAQTPFSICISGMIYVYVHFSWLFSVVLFYWLRKLTYSYSAFP